MVSDVYTGISYSNNLDWLRFKNRRPDEPNDEG